jgi:hypothetical protein
MAMNRALFKKQLEEGLNTVFGLEYKQYPEQWKDIFKTSKEGKKAYVEDLVMAGLGAAVTKTEGSNVTYDQGQEGWVSRYVFETIALAFAITEEAIDDNLYGDLGAKMSKSLARSMQYTKNVKGANILNYAFDSNYTGGDGKALLATDHPLVGGGTFANKLSVDADLSETSLEDMILLMSDCVDDRGLPIPLMAKKLIIPTELQFVAQRILGSELRPGTADNDINAIRSMGYLSGGPAMNNYLTDPDAWFIVTDCNDGLRYIERKGMQTKIEGDFDSGNTRYKAVERYTFGWSDARGLYGSSGS